MSDDSKKPDYTSVDAYIEGAERAAQHPARAMLGQIPWDQPATMIDLEGRVPIIATVRECIQHFALFKPHAKANARMLLTRPVHREGRATRTWLLEPRELDLLAKRMEAES